VSSPHVQHDLQARSCFQGDGVSAGVDLGHPPVAGGQQDLAGRVDGNPVPTSFWAKTGSGTRSSGTRHPDSGASRTSRSGDEGGGHGRQDLPCEFLR